MIKLNLAHSKIFTTCNKAMLYGVDIKSMYYFRKQMLRAFISELLISDGFEVCGVKYTAERIQSHIHCNDMAFKIIFGFARDERFRTALYKALESDSFEQLEFTLRSFAVGTDLSCFSCDDSDDEIRRTYCAYMIECLYFFKQHELSRCTERSIKAGISRIKRDLCIFEQSSTYYCYSTGVLGYRVPESKVNHMDSETNLIGVYKVTKQRIDILFDLLVLYKLDKLKYYESLAFIKAGPDDYIDMDIDKDVTQKSTYDHFKTIKHECKEALTVPDDYEVEFKSNNWKYPECMYPYEVSD